MQPLSRRRRGTTAAPLLWVALAAGCGAGGARPPQPIDGALDAASDGRPGAVDPDAARDVSTVGHCCALELADGSSALCGDLEMDAAPGLVEACLPQNSHGTYGRWTCGAGPEPPVCGDDGLSCGVGEPCTLVDVGCRGIVQTCQL
jgi:hypothetical protein